MHTIDTYRFAFHALPTTLWPLANNEILQVIDLRPNESLLCELPPEHSATDPSTHLFTPPIQFTVIDSYAGNCRIGIYTDPFLRLHKGPSLEKNRVKQAKLTPGDQP